MPRTKTSSMVTRRTAAEGSRLVAADGRTLPLQATTLRVTAAGGLARVVVTQRFRNPQAEPLAVTYCLPLPRDAAVSGFAIVAGRRRISGEIEGRETARDLYEEALAQGRSAALLQSERGSLFTQEIGNIPPGEDVTCEITLDHRLAWLPEGAWEWRFPTVVAPRYGADESRADDAAAIAQDVAETTTARLALDLTIGEPVTGESPVVSPSHAVEVSASGAERRVTLSATEPGALDRDVVVRWTVAGLEPQARIETARHEGDRGAGTFGLLTLVPPAEGAGPEIVPRDVGLILDVSGSMAGAPLAQLKRVAAALVQRLTPRDTLGMTAFASEPETWSESGCAASPEARASALRWIASLQAGGGTEMKAAVVAALARTIHEGGATRTGAGASHDESRPFSGSSGTSRSDEVIAPEGEADDGGNRRRGGSDVEDFRPSPTKPSGASARRMRRLHELPGPARGREGAQRQVVLITDGAVGFERDVVAAIRDRLPRGSRLHAVGVGPAVDRSLTSPCARAGRGAEIVIAADEDAETGIARLLARLDAPLVTDLEVRGTAVVAHAPRALPDLFAGAPVLVGLELKPEGGAIEIVGRTPSGEWRRQLGVAPAAPGAGRAELAPLFGRELVEDLEVDGAAARNREALDADVEQAGLRFGIATTRTSWVAVSEEPSGDPRLPARRVRQPQALPQGLSAEGLGLRGAASGRPAFLGEERSSRLGHPGDAMRDGAPRRYGAPLRLVARAIVLDPGGYVHAEIEAVSGGLEVACLEEPVNLILDRCDVLCRIVDVRSNGRAVLRSRRPPLYLVLKPLDLYLLGHVRAIVLRVRGERVEIPARGLGP